MPTRVNRNYEGRIDSHLDTLVALSKPVGGVRALVMGDVFRRLVSRSCAQQTAVASQSVCAPFQHAWSTRAGSEALARELRLATELEPCTTVRGVDGVGVYDHISLAAVFEGLRRDERLESLIPYVRLFYGSQGTCLFYDAAGEAHVVEQTEKGEQRDPLMPGLFVAGVRGALLAARAALQPGESLSACLDDVYVTSHSNRTTAVFQIIRTETRPQRLAGQRNPGARRPTLQELPARQLERGRAWIPSTCWKKCDTPSQHCSTLRPSCARQCAQHWCRHWLTCARRREQEARP